MFLNIRSRHLVLKALAAYIRKGNRENGVIRGSVVVGVTSRDSESLNWNYGVTKQCFRRIRGRNDLLNFIFLTIYLFLLNIEILTEYWQSKVEIEKYYFYRGWYDSCASKTSTEVTTK